MRILEVNKAYYPHVGGIETLVRQYSEELGKFEDVQVRTLVCRDERGKTRRERINGVDLTRAGSLGTYFKCPVSLSFFRYFRKMAKRSDVVHLNVPFPLADAALLVSGYKGRVVVSWHSDVVNQKKLLFFYKPIMRKMLERADCIIVATEGHIKGSDYLPPFAHKCKVIPYGINVEDYTSVERTPFLTDKCFKRDSVKVFFTGRLVSYKGVDVLLRAFRMVEGCELFIAGTGELEASLKRYAEVHDMGRIVHFLGYLPDKELKQAYADCDIFVLPSIMKNEAFGIVQQEAMVYGKPVINTRINSGVPYVSIHGKTGLTVPPSDPKALAWAINRLASDPELRAALGRNAAKRIEISYSERNIIHEIYKALKG